MGNLRSRTVVAERLWDWEFLNGCFRPTKIRISDVDGEVERNGFFLRLEGKPLGFNLSTAQRIWFEKLLLLRRPIGDGDSIRAFTILVLYGEPGEPEQMQAWPDAIKPCTKEDVFAFVHMWFEYASALSE